MWIRSGRLLSQSLRSSPWRQSVHFISEKSTGGGTVSHTLSEIQKIRLDKIKEMQENGIIPYAYSYQGNTTVSELRQKYSSSTSLSPGEEDSSAEVSLAGRIMVRRFFGKLAFFELQDHTDTIQLYVDKGRLGNQFKTIQAWTDNGASLISRPLADLLSLPVLPFGLFLSVCPC
jgi:lysyl-tRNA synthetase class II